ncbi:MAG TPA: alanine--tRNA ligase-related protein [Candidatus Saccharimonadales bacterium]|nr:alanine--tRNA ligase-related protein [Candidatus Saccharimonadales bacterium]
MSSPKESYFDSANLPLKDIPFSSEEIDVRQQQLQQLFRGFYSSLGYVEHPPYDIYSKIDPSVLFVGATISSLKAYLLSENIPEEGLSILQPCLRTHTKDYFYDDSQIADYNSYFTQAGILARPDHYEKMCQQSLEFLTNRVGIPPGDIKIKISPDDIDMLQYWDTVIKPVTVEAGQEAASFYRWQYGLENVAGRGLTYSIRFANTEEFRDIGNVICIEKEGRKIGVEWGFGIETLLSRVYDLRKPLETSTISQLIPFNEGVQEKFSDAVVATSVMLRSGIEPGKGGAKQILKVHLNAVRYLGAKLGFNFEILEDLINAYELQEFNDISGISKNFRQYLEQYQINTANFSRSALDIKRSCLQRKVDPAARLEELRRKYGLHTVEAEQILTNIL